MIYFNFKDNCEGKPLNSRSLLRHLILRIISKIIPIANPDFEDKIGYVYKWYLEYDDVNYDEVLREIGLNANGEIILKMPDKRNFGFWMDTNLKFKDFKDKFDIEMITEQEFNDLWNSVVYDRDADEFKPVVINRKVL